jgi:hypothetical protein
MAELKRENARLEAELAAAHARIAELERACEHVANRIDWVVDSIHNVTGDRT